MANSILINIGYIQCSSPHLKKALSTDLICDSCIKWTHRHCIIFLDSLHRLFTHCKIESHDSS